MSGRTLIARNAAQCSASGLAQRHDDCDLTVIDDGARPDDERDGYALIDKHISERWLEVIEAVKNERGVRRKPGTARDRQPGVAARYTGYDRARMPAPGPLFPFIYGIFGS